MARIKCPVYGFYGGNDGLITMTAPKTAEAMKKAGKTYEPVTYEGAGHGRPRRRGARRRQGEGEQDGPRRGLETVEGIAGKSVNPN